jgi:hypothetical protein
VGRGSSCYNYGIEVAAVLSSFTHPTTGAQLPSRWSPAPAESDSTPSAAGSRKGADSSMTMRPNSSSPGSTSLPGGITGVVWAVDIGRPDGSGGVVESEGRDRSGGSTAGDSSSPAQGHTRRSLPRRRHNAGQRRSKRSGNCHPHELTALAHLVSVAVLCPFRIMYPKKRPVSLLTGWLAAGLLRGQERDAGLANVRRVQNSLRTGGLCGTP